jgi:GNAT superfamily N-acetyltransferase
LDARTGVGCGLDLASGRFVFYGFDMVDGISARPLTEAEWVRASDLSSRANWGEPWVEELYGSDPIRRWAAIHAADEQGRFEDYSLHVGLFAGTALVGTTVGSVEPDCYRCRWADATSEPDGDEERINWTFYQAVAAAHRRQSSHGWISHVAVEPSLQGLGLGKVLMYAVVDEAVRQGSSVMLLDCQPHNAPFYAAVGFHVVGSIPDPVGPDAVLMSAHVGPTSGPDRQ